MTRSIRLFSAGVALLAAVAMPMLYAQPAPEPGGSAAEQQQSPQVLLQEMEQVQQELLQIQEAAMAQNPELREQADSLQATLLEAMRTEGFDPMQSLARLEQLEQQLQSEDVNSSKRPALIEELHNEQQRLMQAEQVALENQEVQQARDQFMAGLLEAMRAQSPETDELVASLQQKNAQLQEIISAQSQ